MIKNAVGKWSAENDVMTHLLKNRCPAKLYYHTFNH